MCPLVYDSFSTQADGCMSHLVWYITLHHSVTLAWLQYCLLSLWHLPLSYVTLYDHSLSPCPGDGHSQDTTPLGGLAWYHLCGVGSIGTASREPSAWSTDDSPLSPPDDQFPRSPWHPDTPVWETVTMVTRLVPRVGDTDMWPHICPVQLWL